jgi:hypothetical protein
MSNEQSTQGQGMMSEGELEAARECIRQVRLSPIFYEVPPDVEALRPIADLAAHYAPALLAHIEAQARRDAEICDIVASVIFDHEEMRGDHLRRIFELANYKPPQDREKEADNGR